jgi:aldose 1-epimerase
MTYGATLTDLLVPDRDGLQADVVLGFDQFARYPVDSPYFGCTVGRVANRISGARFGLDGADYRLAANDGPNHLHGGQVGFDKAVWRAEAAAEAGSQVLRLVHRSPAGDEGYPGNLDVSVTYRLALDGALSLEYEATTDAPTLVNLTNHSYFNLAGKGDILGHILTLYASRYTEPDAQLTPTGRILPVAGTPLDFRRPAAVGGRLARLDIGGYDHNYVIDGGPDPLALAAELYEPGSGRAMEVLTTKPGIQLYTGNFLDGLAGKGGAVYQRHAALCLETQYFPDAIHHPAFPSPVLRPGQTYRHTTVHRFSCR